MKLVFLLEEPSTKYLLDELLPRILPEGVLFQTIPHNGKHALEKSIPRKLRGWNEPGDIRFVILHDQDTKDCHELKKPCVRELTVKFWFESLAKKWNLGILAIWRRSLLRMIIQDSVKYLLRRNIAFRTKSHLPKKNYIALYQNIIKLQVPSELHHTWILRGIHLRVFGNL